MTRSGPSLPPPPTMKWRRWVVVLKKTLLFILSPNLKTRVETLTKALAEQQQLNSVKYLKCRAMCPVCVRE